MSADEHLGMQFHGTHHRFEPGDVVQPGRVVGHSSEYARQGVVGDDVNDYAHAIDDPNKAFSYAKRARTDHVYSQPYGARASLLRTVQAHVYGVTPVGTPEPDPRQRGSVRSREGFRVTHELSTDELRG